MFSRKVAILAAVVAAVAACERPTAPEARDLARDLERKVQKGDLQAIANLFFYLGPGGFFLSTSYDTTPGPLVILRDGAADTLNAYVLEEIHLAPSGIGQPIVRRTLVGWPEDRAFALYATLSDDEGEVSPSPERSMELTPYRYLTVHHIDSTRSWVPLAGRIGIGSPVVEKDCGLRPPLDFGRPEVTCEFASYEVSARGEFARKFEILSGAFAARRQLVVLPQRVPGVRFTTTCPVRRVDLSLGMECWHVMQFWRNNRFFAPALNVDVHQLRRVPRTGDPASYVRRMPANPVPGSEIVRWTVHSPDGRLIERDSSGPGLPQPSRRDLENWFRLVGFTSQDSRIQAVVPAIMVDSRASEYAVAVVNIERGAVNRSQ